MKDGPIPITTVALDNRVDLNEVRGRLPWPEQKRFAYGSLFGLPDNTRLYLYSFGAVVHDGVSGVDEGAKGIVEAALRRAYLLDTCETYYVAIEAGADPASPRVGWDRVVIAERSHELMNAVALLVGQSAALERYERATSGLMDEALLLARQLGAGKLPFSSRTLTRRVGRITADRLELARWFYLVDKPAETWEDARVAVLYDALFRNLELDERHRAMLHKLEAMETATQTIIDLWQGRHSNMLEWAIIGLIVFEILMALLKAS